MQSPDIQLVQTLLQQTWRMGSRVHSPAGTAGMMGLSSIKEPLQPCLGVKAGTAGLQASHAHGDGILRYCPCCKTMQLQLLS